MNTKAENTFGHLTLEDLSVGQTFQSETYTLNAEKIKSFAKEYDPQPFHTDEKAAVGTFFDGLAASGWQTASITMRLLVPSLPILGGLIGASCDINWTKPTRPGDTLHVESEILEIKPSRSRPDRGAITIRSMTKNQNGETVQTLVSRLVVPRRTTDESNL
jgi:acyl dehydratase